MLPLILTFTFFFTGNSQSIVQLCQAATFTLIGDYIVQTSGDYNKDGIGDLVFSSGPASANVYVVYGTSGPFPNVNIDATSPTPGFPIGASDAVSKINSAKNIGDINNDGIDDIILGVDSHVPLNTGRVYIVYGKNGGSSYIDARNMVASQGFKIRADNPNDYFGKEVGGLGDINNDGISDFYVTTMSKVYLIYGRSGGYTTFSITGIATSVGISFNFPSAPKSAGDMNGDGIGDFMVGSPSYSSYRGAVYIIYGRAGGYPSSFSIDSMLSNQGYKITGSTPGDNLGYSFEKTGDFNGDGRADIAISVPQPDSGGNGAVYVIYGSSTNYADITISSMTAARGLKISPDSTESWTGRKIALSTSNDINGDVRPDLIIGVSNKSIDGSVSNSLSVSYVIFGKSRAYLDLSISSLTAAEGYRMYGVESSISARKVTTLSDQSAFFVPTYRKISILTKLPSWSCPGCVDGLTCPACPSDYTCYLDCPTSAPNRYIGHCYTTCPPSVPFVYNKVCQATCPTGSPYIYKQVCYSYCPSEVRYSYNNQCLTACPADAPYNKNDNYACIAACPTTASKQIGFTCYAYCPYPMTYSYNNQCMTACPATARYNYNYVCAAACPVSAPYSYYFTCSSSCSYPAYYAYNNECVRACPPAAPYKYNYDYICYTACPSGAPNSYKFNCYSTCPPGTLLYNKECFVTCPTAAPYKSGSVCYTSCPSGAPNAYNSLCYSTCPIEAPYSSNNQCLRYCPVSAPNRYNFDCYSTCPTSAPYLYGTNCVGSCPTEAPVEYNKICTTTCPGSAIIRYGNTCYTDCPTSAPFLYLNECYTTCPSSVSFIYKKSCYATCPAVAPKSDGNTCYSDCPTSAPFLHLSSCYTTCPGAAPLIYGNVCHVNCPTVAPKKYGNTCYSDCPTSAPFLHLDSCYTTCPITAQYNYKNICYVNCPTVAPKTYGSNCYTDCPASAPFLYSVFCHPTCPSYAPLIYKNNCYLNCPASAPKVYGNACYEVCPPLAPLEYAGACYSDCPPLAPKQYKGSCYFNDPSVEEGNATSAGTASQTQDIASGALVALTLLSSGDPSALLLSSLNDMLQYTRYLQISHSSALEKMYNDSGSTSSGSFLNLAPKVPDDFMTDSRYSSTPPPFQRYNLTSPFLVNYWDTLISIFIIAAIALGICITDYLGLKFSENKVMHMVTRKLKIISLNLLLVQFYTSLGQIAFLSPLNLRTLSLEDWKDGMNIAILSFCFIASIVTIVAHYLIIRKYQTIKSERNEPKFKQFLTRTKPIQLLYSEFQDTSTLQQAFLLFFVVRDIIFNLAISVLFEYPLAQIAIFTCSSLIILVFLVVKKPFRSMIDLMQLLLMELVMLVVNISLLIIAISDQGDGDAELVESLDAVMIWSSIIINVLGMVFFVPKIVSVAIDVFKFLHNYIKKQKMQDKLSNTKKKDKVRTEEEIRKLKTEDSLNMSQLEYSGASMDHSLQHKSPIKPKSSSIMGNE